MNNLIEEYFEIETTKGSYQAKYVSPIWARGLDCKPSSCGLCCISATPQLVPKKTFSPLGNKICSYLNIDKKVCKTYERRPYGCKIAPFFFGIENGQIIISPSLECPSTNKSKINMSMIKKTFNNSSVRLQLDDLDDIFNQTKSSKEWDSIEEFWVFLKGEIKSFFDSNNQFPFLDELTELVQDCIDRYFNINTVHNKQPSIDQLVTSITNGQCFISTNFESNEILHVRIKKLKAYLTYWNPKTGQIRKIKTRLAKQSKEIQIQEDGMQLLKDYLSLLFERPFLSISTVYQTSSELTLPETLTSVFLGNFVHLESGANLLAYKFADIGIDRNSMRELVSFADSCLLGLFRNPKTYDLQSST